MKRIIIMVFRNIFFVPWWTIQLLWYAREKDQHTEEQKYALLKKIVRGANKGGKVTIQSDGQENIPRENGFIMYPNHQGMYDVLSLIESCEKPISVVMKKEVRNVPLISQVRRIMQAEVMDRADVRQSLQVIINVTKKVLNGKNFVIFPEGTRSRKGNQLLEFKSGSFKAAVKAKAPIVPVALINSFLPFDSHSVKPVTVQVHFLPPLYYQEYKDMKTVEIASIVKERIENKIAECLQDE
ncbi:MAG: lysophospholipid acyltransferase family protein [Marvinbryantia sp.]|jgi:1-acyl-sn-glycerol-3-phosphate acyltransferase